VAVSSTSGKASGASVAAPVSSALAFKGLATIIGTVQGPIQGDNTSKDGPGAIVIRAMSFGVEREDSDERLPASVQHARFRLVKEPDRATPKLLLAAATDERLNVEIRWFRSLSTGVVQHYFTVKLQNALIVNMDAPRPSPATPSAGAGPGCPAIRRPAG